MADVRSGDMHLEETGDWCLKAGENHRRVYSQGRQDGVIEYVFRNIAPLNDPPFAVEFGFNAPSLTSGSGSNIANLVLNHGWNALLLDGEFENVEINLRRHFLTTDNILDVFRMYEVPQNLDYLSIDVDSCDLWLMDRILSAYAPTLITVEYNPNFPIHQAITMVDEPFARFIGDRVYGASLKALNIVTESHGYALIDVIHGLDAVFVRKERVPNSTFPPLSAFASRCDHPIHLPCRLGSGRMKLLIDYEAYLENGGDAEAASAANDPEVRRACRRLARRSEVLALASHRVFKHTHRLIHNARRRRPHGPRHR